jgi:P4 family phage/plasmid primase-like protien
MGQDIDDARVAAYGELIDHMRKHNRHGDETLKCTHTSMYPKMGLHIEDDSKLKRRIKSLNREVKRSLRAGRRDVVRHCISERPPDGEDGVGIFRMELDFKYPKFLKGMRLYNRIHIERVGEVVWEVMNEYINVRRRHRQLFVLEKEKPTLKRNEKDPSKDGWSDGFKFMSPFIHIKNRLLKLIIIKVRDIVAERQILDNIVLTNRRGGTNDTDLEPVFDMGCVSNVGWTNYGGAKPNGLPYNLSCVYGYDMRQIDADYSDDDLVDLLSIRRSRKRDLAEYADDVDDDSIDDELEEYGAKRRPNLAAERGRSLKDRQKRIEESPEIEPVPSLEGLRADEQREVERAQKLVQMLSKTRATDYSTWMRVGWCLKNIHRALLPEWIAFSKKAPSFKRGECEKKWPKMNYSGFGMSALRQWAMHDNKKEYKKFTSAQIHDSLYEATSGNSLHVAMAVKNMYGPEFVSVNVEKNEWFRFNGQTYEADYSHLLFTKITTDVVNEFIDLQSYFNEQCKGKSGSEKDMYLKKSEDVGKLVKKLCNKKFPDEVISQCRRLFYVDRFKELLDANADLLGMADGIYDLKEGMMREGTPDDLVSMSTGHKFKAFNEKDAGIRWVLNFMAQLQPNERIREYLWLLFASCLDGYNREEKFHLLTGKGCFGRGTNVLMANGARCPVESIRIGDNLMGWDSLPRTVTRIFSDRGRMYKLVTPERTMRVSADHKLVLMVEDPRVDTDLRTGKTHATWLEKYVDDAEPILHREEIFGITMRSEAPEPYIDEIIGRKFTEIKRNKRNICGEMIVVTADEFACWPEEVRRMCYLMHGALDDDEMEYQEVKIDPDVMGRLLAQNCAHDYGNRIPKEYINNDYRTRSRLLESLQTHLPMAKDKLVVTNPGLAKDIILLARTLGKNTRVECTDPSHCRIKIDDRWNGMEEFVIMDDGVDQFHGFELAIRYQDSDGRIKWDDSSEDASKFFLEDMTVVSNSNGKSKLITLVQKALKDYATSVDPTLFTKKTKDAEGASPEKARLKGKRAVFSSEAEDDDKFAMSVVKQMTGNDVINARPLYQTGFQFVCYAKFIFALNKLPFVKANDDASWRRLRVIEFKSRFCDKPDPKKQEFMIDCELQTKLDLYAGDMLACLMHYYKKYKAVGKLRDIPEIVISSQAYKNDNDVMGEFYTELMEPGKKHKEKMTEVLKAFQLYAKTTCPANTTLPTKKEFMAFFEEKGFAIKAGMVWGARLRDNEIQTDID